MRPDAEASGEAIRLAQLRRFFKRLGLSVGLLAVASLGGAIVLRSWTLLVLFAEALFLLGGIALLWRFGTHVQEALEQALAHHAALGASHERFRALAVATSQIMLAACLQQYGANVLAAASAAEALGTMERFLPGVELAMVVANLAQRP